MAKPSEEQAGSVAQEGDDMENTCVCCGAVIPEGRQVCPKCEATRPTNYDRIKAMDMKELAEFICENTKECGDCVGYDYCSSDGCHANGMIKWMKKKSED